MSNFPDEDQKLVEFLRQYQPTTPASSKDGETQLMRLIAQYPRRQSWQKYRRIFWLLPTMVAALGLTFWLAKPRVTPSLSIASDTHELENFMINSWEHSLGNSPETSVEYTSFDEMLPTSSEPEQSVSQP